MAPCSRTKNKDLWPVAGCKSLPGIMLELSASLSLINARLADDFRKSVLWKSEEPRRRDGTRSQHEQVQLGISPAVRVQSSFL